MSSWLTYPYSVVKFPNDVVRIDWKNIVFWCLIPFITFSVYHQQGTVDKGCTKIKHVFVFGCQTKLIDFIDSQRKQVQEEHHQWYLSHFF